MWEAIAPIIRWPLYSPRRFVAVVIAALIGVFVIGEINDEPSEPTSTPGAASLVTSTGAASPPPSATPTSTVPSDASATDELSVDPAEHDRSAAAADAAAAFVAAWARPDLDTKAWAVGVRPLATSELWTTGLSLTDPSRTPEVTVRGEPRQVAMNAEEGVLDVPTTGPWVRVHVVPGPSGDRWLVSRVEPVD
ncbi:hypothetical protein [Cellulomonas fengjieae]|uniref:hypothetical protein n=1 Tax=Cellulomonas fengjieae TaxID=2819978 RepID=UPI001AAF2353|nr:hypothetical protein [Cellulomonas fengjieae]MBO3102215.1 hypothetical protein [Cellulomonas fengjieae]